MVDEGHRIQSRINRKYQYVNLSIFKAKKHLEVDDILGLHFRYQQSSCQTGPREQVRLLTVHRENYRIGPDQTALRRCLILGQIRLF